MLEAGPSPVARLVRQLALLPLLAWALVLVLAGMPDEISPSWTDGLRRPVKSYFMSRGLQLSHEVFSGNRGDSKRRFWGMRVLAWHPDGSSTLLLESTPELKIPALRLTVPLTFVVLYRRINYESSSKLFSNQDPERRVELVRQLRRSGDTRRLGSFFCRSERYAWAGERRSISFEIYRAAESYKSGKIRGYRDTIYHGRCPDGRSLNHWPEPTFEPDWPQVKNWG